MIKIVLFLLTFLWPSYIFTYSIVFIHLGKNLPQYLPDAIWQARLFNQSCDIYLLANQHALKHYTPTEDLRIKKIPVENLKKTKIHRVFLKTSALNRDYRDGFWLLTSERFFYLDDFLRQFDLKEVFHLENDNLLYVNLEDLMPIFLAKYPGIAAVFDSDTRCIPSFIYIAQKHILHALAKCFLRHAKSGKTDMEILSIFKNTYNNGYVDNLPIIPSAYSKRYPLKNLIGSSPKNPSIYSKNIDLFESIFDGAALGQYLGGIDPRNGTSQAGFINEHCLFNPRLATYSWIPDDLGRNVPFMIFENKAYKINNLHIHCKNLKKFLSIPSFL